MSRRAYTGIKSAAREAEWNRDMDRLARSKKRTGTTRKVGYYDRYRKKAAASPYHAATEERELKFFDVDMNDTTVSQAGTVLADGGNATINRITQGVGPSQRIGRKAIIKKIAWRWNCILESESSSGTQSSETLRVVLFLDRQCNGTAATAIQILETDDFQSFNQLVNKGRFTIMSDQIVDFSSQAGAGNGTANHWPENSKSGEFYKDCQIPIEFNGATGNITEIRSNNMGILLVSRAGGLLVFTSKIRLRFFD